MLQARAVLASEATDASMLFLQGLAHEKRDELVEAVDCYAQVLEEEPDAWRAHFHLAKLHLNVGLVAAAVSETATRYLDFDFGLTVGIATAFVIAGGAILIQKNVPRLVRRP